MSRVDFAFGAVDRLRMACETVRKQFLSGRRLVVYAGDRSLLKHFDRLLWGFEATAFIPHVWVNDPLAEATPVLLTVEPPSIPASAAKEPTWLLNLDTNCPPNADAFERVLEIVSDDPQDVQSARQRWRHYKAAGHDLHAHDLSARNQ